MRKPQQFCLREHDKAHYHTVLDGPVMSCAQMSGQQLGGGQQDRLSEHIFQQINNRGYGEALTVLRSATRFTDDDSPMR